MHVRSLFHDWIHFIFAPRCFACNDLLPPGAEAGAAHCFCSLCLESLIPLTAPHCSQCAEPFDSGTANHRCGLCLGDSPAFEGVFAPFEYGGALAAAVQRLKYSNAAYMAPGLAALIHSAVGCAFDVIVPVPLHPRRLRSRGYNQSALLARELAARCGTPVLPLVLRRCTNDPPQVGKGKQERIQNMKNAFSVVDPGGKLAGRTVLLVDDVVTSTATVRAAARALKTKGMAHRVYVCCLGRTSSER